jgi:predicted HD superfamily hydrolase involved in NAD metabolism
MWSERKIEAYLRENLKEKRFIHTLGVRDTAVKLAKLYSENAAKASLAALLHDCAKSLSDKELIHMVSKKGCKIDWIHEKSPQLLHGHAAAIIAEDIMEVMDKDVLEAVTYHTTGKSNMSTLVKIIYLADYIEPGRSFPGVEELRKTAEVNLDEAVLMALEGTIKYVISCRQLLHPDTIEARNYLLIKRQ